MKCVEKSNIYHLCCTDCGQTIEVINEEWDPRPGNHPELGSTTGIDCNKPGCQGEFIFDGSGRTIFKVIDNYIKNSHICPFCGSEHIEGTGDHDYGNDKYYNRIGCPDCGKVWDDVYTLSGIEEVE